MSGSGVYGRTEMWLHHVKLFSSGLKVFPDSFFMGAKSGCADALLLA